MFEILQTMENFKIKLKCFMVELYLNHLRDLLLPKGKEVIDLQPKKSVNGVVELPGVTEVELDSVQQAEDIFE